MTVDLDKQEVDTIVRALGRTVEVLRASRFVGDADPHFLKIEALYHKIAELS